MTSPTLPVSRVINVQVNLSPSAAQAESLSTLLLLGSSDVISITERFRDYNTIDEVAADFGTTVPEYLAAVLWFEQTPQPATLSIGRWADAPTSGELFGATLSAAEQLISNFNTISAGRFNYSLDGGSAADTPPIDFTAGGGVANLPAVAAAISALTSPGMTVTWDSNNQRFYAQSASTGTVSQVSFFSTPGSGTDISGLLQMRSDDSGAFRSPGIAAETALACVSYFDLNYGQKFYGLMIIGASDSDTEAIANFIEASGNKHAFFTNTNEGAVLVPNMTSLASALKALGLNRTYTQYSSSNPYAAMSAAARILPTDYTANNSVITLFYKQEPGVVAENINSNQADALESYNCNVFVNYNNDTAIIEPGICASGLFLDILCGTDWFSLQIQAALYNLLYTSRTKIPQTDAGTQQLINVIEAVCAQAVFNGLLAPGVWNSQGFGLLNQGEFLVKGYYVWAPKVATQNQADRAKRKSVPISVAAKLAGAVHTIAMTVNVNQ